ncbi:MAG: transglycosylase SLT domain-containing protein [Candidatus Binatia bacterium]
MLAARGAPGAAEALRAARAGGDDDVRQAAALALGEVALRDGDAAEAAAQFDAARRLRPGSPPARAAKARLVELRARQPALAPRGAALDAELRLLLRERDDPAAQLAADQLLATSPSPRALRARAEAEYGAGDVDAAVATLSLLVQRYPRAAEAPDAQLRGATMCWNKDRDAPAAAAFRTYLERWPHGPGAPEAQYALARIAQGEGRNDEAVAGYRRLIAAAPASRQAPEARWRIGWIAYQDGRWRDAAAAFSAAQGGGVADAPDAAYWRARSLERAGERDEALRGYRALLDAAPGSYYAYWAEQRLSGTTAPRQVVVSPPPPVALGAPPAGADAYHWRKAGALQAAGALRDAHREMAAVERFGGDVPAVAAALPTAYQAVGGYHDAIRLASARGTATADVLYPLAFWPQVARAADAERIDPLIPLALMRQESLFDPAARSSADARGLMQLLPSTAERVARGRGLPPPADHLEEPAVNIALGTAHLADLLRSYDGDPLKAFAAYNGGEEAVARWQQRFGALPGDELVENITYRETRDYVKKVMGNYRRYQQLYGRQP